jgi:hypothetical protein
MKHFVKFNREEKINIWLDLCDFTFRLMANSLDERQLEKRLARMREEDLKRHREFLSRLGEEAGSGSFSRRRNAKAGN